MSGGTFGYYQHEIHEHLDEIADYIESDYPLISGVLRGLSQALLDCLDTLDLHYSGDKLIRNPARFDEEWSDKLAMWEE